MDLTATAAELASRCKGDVKVNHFITITRLIEKCERIGAGVDKSEFNPGTDEEAVEMIRDLFCIIELASVEHIKETREEKPTKGQLSGALGYCIKAAIREGRKADTNGDCFDIIEKFKLDNKGTGPGDRTKKQARVLT